MKTDLAETTREALRQATRGLIGDKVRRYSSKELYARVFDQCDRLNHNKPAWPVFVDACHAEGYTFLDAETVQFN